MPNRDPCAPLSEESLISVNDLSRLKICLLAGTLGQGGAERQLFYILQTLRRCGAAPRLLCLGQREFWEDPIKKLGVPITPVGAAPSRLKRLFRIVAELRKDPPAIFQSQHFYTNFYVAAAARWVRSREIGAMRNDGISGQQDGGRLAGWLNLRPPRLLAANSRAAIRYAAAKGVRPDRLYFLENVVDTQSWKPTPRLQKGHIQLITVGRLIELKRLDRFLTALAQLRKATNREVRGTIVGVGPLKERLQKQAEILGLLPSAVQFRAGVAEMAPLYQEADICVLTSDHEGTPNALLEAMASGLPVVATRVGGVPDIVHHGRVGLLVDAGDEENLCMALETLISNAQLRMQLGRNARAYVENNHSLHGLPAKLIELYRLALS